MAPCQFRGRSSGRSQAQAQRRGASRQAEGDGADRAAVPLHHRFVRRADRGDAVQRGLRSRHIGQPAEYGGRAWRLERQGAAGRRGLRGAGRRSQGGRQGQDRGPRRQAAELRNFGHAQQGPHHRPQGRKVDSRPAVQGAGPGRSIRCWAISVSGRRSSARAAPITRLLSAEHARSATRTSKARSSASPGAGRYTSRFSAARCASACSSRSSR